MLAFDLIEYAINFIQDLNNKGKKKIRYTISTNGSLLNKKILNFLSRHRFSVLLSFDGFAQDITRQKGSFGLLVSKINDLLKTPDIELETNSVFTQKTIGYLTKSIQLIHELGVPKIEYTLSQNIPWEKSHMIQLEKELLNLRKMMQKIYQNDGIIPLENFKKKTSIGIYTCNAGENRLDITADGKLWGCSLFADYFKGKEETDEYAKYCFGDLHSFIKNHDKIYPTILKNYAGLRMDRYYTPNMRCSECNDLYFCGACPGNNLLTSGDVRKIAGWECEINKILRMNKKLFWEELESQM